MTPRELVNITNQLDLDSIRVHELIEFVQEHTDADPREIRQAIYETFPVTQSGRVYL